MLDYGKQYGTYEGVTFYGDHEDDRVVYYLPDEVFLVKGKDSRYDLDLTLFRENNTITDGKVDLKDTVGAFLQLGVCCTVEELRLEKAIGKLKDQVSLPSDIRICQPAWKDGTVELMVYDRQGNGTEARGDTGFVKSILGSQRPSFQTNDLKSIFNVCLDQRGAELVYTALRGGKGTFAGVMYDLQFPVLMPAADLRISANLSRCQETAAHELGAGFSYQGKVDISLAAGLNSVTEKMIENGDIKIEVLSLADTDAERKRIQELVSEFKERVMQELFSPQITMQSPQIDFSLDKTLETAASLAKSDHPNHTDGLGKNGDKVKQNSKQEAGKTDGTKDDEDDVNFTPPSIKVTYVFKKEKIDSSKILEVDYRERSTTLKPHNPQSHLSAFGVQLGASLKDYISQVNFGDVWKNQIIHTQIDPDIFDTSGLKVAEVAFWKKEFGIATQKSGSRFSNPESVSPLVASLTKNQPTAKLNWTRENADDVGYYYQVCFGYGNEEIYSEPFLSFSRNLVIIPELCIFNRTLHVRGSGIDYSLIRNVDVRLDIKDPDGERAPEYVLLSESKNEGFLTVRGRYRNQTSIQMTKMIDFLDGSKISYTTSVFSSEIPVYSPLLNKSLTLVFAGASERILCIIMDVTVSSAVFEGKLKKRFEFRDLSIPVVQAVINVLDDADLISYDLYAVRDDGELLPLESGVSDGKPIQVRLSEASRKNLVLELIGRSPEDAGLKRVEIWIAEEGKEAVKYEFKGSVVPAPIELKVSPDANISVKIVKRWQNGDKEVLENVPIQNGKISVRCE